MGYISQKDKQPTDDDHYPEKILFPENIGSRGEQIIRYSNTLAEY